MTSLNFTVVDPDDPDEVRSWFEDTIADLQSGSLTHGRITDISFDDLNSGTAVRVTVEYTADVESDAVCIRGEVHQLIADRLRKKPDLAARLGY